MLKRDLRPTVQIDFEPPTRWPLWFLGHDAFDVEELAPISKELRAFVRSVSEYFATNTQWCDRASQFFFVSEQSFIEFNHQARSLANSLRAELGDDFRIHEVSGSLNRDGHISFKRISTKSEAAQRWFAHDCHSG
jgi:hypothetical protein